MDSTTLRELPLFEGLSDDDVERCAALFQERAFLAGSSLASEGDFAYKFFVVLDGRVQVHRGFDLVAELGPGEFFGEAGIVKRQRRNARVTAKVRSTLAWVMSWDFATMLEEFPTVAERIDAAMRERAE
jgi:CRP-like cAMP-binding protein